MRTKILQTMRANGWRRLAITSPTPACGKSTVALNLAFSFARQPDVRLILTELDLRRPSLGRLLNSTHETGIEDVLRGTLPFSEQALRYGDNLALSLARRPVRDAAELFQADKAAQVLAGIEADYAPDLMIFDTPPMLASDDVMAISAHIDCALIVAGAENTTIKQIDVCERDLAAQTNVMGVVLNKCRFIEEEQSYYNYQY
jgi:Mrp family chromosome partitioning ATPase